MRLVYLIFCFIIIQSCSTKTVESPIKKSNDVVIYNSLLISYFGSQEVWANSKIKIHFAAIDDHLEKVEFSVGNLPDFIKMKTFKNGTGYFEVKSSGRISESKIQLVAQNGTQKSIVNCNVKLRGEKGPSQRIYLKDFPKGVIDCKNINDGDIVYLTTGFYKSILIDGKKDLTFVTSSDADVQIGQIKIINSENITLNGLLVNSAANFLGKKEFLIDVDSSSSYITISNCDIQSISDSKLWSHEDWNTNASSGIYIKGKHCKVINNFIQNVFHAIQTDNDFNEVSYNIVDRFSGDAIRNIGNDNKFIKNTLKNATVADYADKDGNHDDLFQSWTFGNPIKRIEIVQNNCISILEPDLPLKSKVVQGIACFDGFEEDWLVKKNLVVIDHPHGVALFGAKNCKILGNKIIRNPYRFDDFEADPWIMINRHKDGRKSISNQVKYNVVDTIVIKDKFSVLTAGNSIINKKTKAFFRDYEGWDFRKK